MGNIIGPETHVTNYESTLRNVPVKVIQCSSQNQRGFCCEARRPTAWALTWAF